MLARPEAVLYGVRRLRRLRAVLRTARLATDPELITDGNPSVPQHSCEAAGGLGPEMSLLPCMPGR